MAAEAAVPPGATDLGARLRRWHGLGQRASTAAEAGRSATAVLAQAQELIAALNQTVVEKQQESLVELVKQIREVEEGHIRQQQQQPPQRSAPVAATGPTTPQLEDWAQLSEFVYNVCAKVVILPAQPLLWHCCTAVSNLDSQAFHAQVKRFQAEPQDAAVFEIPTALQSPSGWADPIRQLQRLQTVTMPSELLAIILGCIRSIHATYAQEQQQKQEDTGDEPSQPRPLGADDLLPILIYVTVKAAAPPRGVRELLVRTEMIQRLGDQASLIGEGGYFFTLFYSALTFITQLLGNAG